jgi:hypothetical protein
MARSSLDTSAPVKQDDVETGTDAVDRVIDEPDAERRLSSINNG